MKRLLLVFAIVAATGMMSQQGLGQSIRANGAEIHYEIEGAGPPLMLLHGIGGCGRLAWGPYVDDLKPFFRLIMVDLRGHGASTNPSGVFTHRQVALDLFALLDSLGIQRFQALGMSSGGMALLHMATQQPARVQAMVVASATSYFPPEAREAMRKYGDPATMEPAVRKRRALCAKRGDPQIDELQRYFGAFKDSYDDMNFTPPLLGTIQARTLIVHGDRDPLFPVAIAVEMYRAIPRAQLWIVPNTGHELPQNKSAFIQTVLGFLRAPDERR